MRINEKTELERIVPNLDDDLFESFRDMWYDDLQQIYNNKELLLTGARSIVTYFNSPVKIQGVEWDHEENCLIWNVQLPVV